MGIKLMVEVMDDAPPSLAWRELYVLLALAETANDGTRLCWPAFDGDSERSKRFRGRCRCSRTQFYAVMKSLEAYGVVETVVEACKGKQAVYKITQLATATAKPGAPVRKPRAQPKKRVPLDGTQSDGHAKGIGNPSGIPHGELTEGALSPVQRDTNDANVSRTAEQWVPSNGTPTPQFSSRLQTLNAANAAREGWGVWGEGSATATSDADSRPAAASADAAAGDGLRPRGYAAPAQMNDQRNGTDKKPAPTKWDPGQEQQRQAERSRILAAIEPACEDMLLVFELALGQRHGAALAQGRRLARTDRPAPAGGTPANPALHERIWALVHAYNLRPLAGWPISVLPIPLREPELKETAA